MAQPDSVLDKKPSWRFRLMDLGGEWSCGDIEKSCLLTVREKLSEFEKEIWKDIDDRIRNHLIPVFKIDPKAQKRLQQLGLDEYDQLYRFRLTKKQRLWGIRELECFYILWWDPNHTVCPSVS